MVQQQEGVLFEIVISSISYGFIIPDANPDFSTDGKKTSNIFIISVCPPDCHQVQRFQIPQGGRKGNILALALILRSSLTLLTE